MSTYLTGSPASVRRDGQQAVGRPYSHLPAVLLCTQGERYCGWRRTARTEAEILAYTGEKREHEATCRGGLIVAGR
jgi:hypothetical protein